MDRENLDLANKLRKSLGMPPIPLPPDPGKSGKPSSAVDDEQDERNASEKAESNWRKYEEAQAAARARNHRAKTLEKLRKQQARNRMLEGPTLGDSAPKMDAKTWLKGQKRRIEQIQREREQEEEEEQRKKARLAAYSSKDLSGVKVNHNADDFSAGTDQILTLTDRIIGRDDDDDGEDVLENAEILAKERLKEKLQNKAKKAAYNPLDDDGMSAKPILAQYDEELEGKTKARHQFTLDTEGSYAHSALKAVKAEEKQAFVLYNDMFSDAKQPQSDFKEAKEKKKKYKQPELDENGRPVFRKRDKQQKKRQTARAQDPSSPEAVRENGNHLDNMNIDGRGSAHDPAVDESTLPQPKRRSSEDEEKFLSSLRQDERTVSALPYKKTESRAAKVLKRVQEASAKTAEDSGGTITSLSMENFLNQHLDPKRVHEQLAEEDERERLATVANASQATNFTEDVEALKARIRAEAGGDIEMILDIEENLQSRSGDNSREASAPASSLLEAQEETAFSSIGNTLALLRRRGEIKEADSEATKRIAQHAKFLEKQRHTRARLEAEAQAQKARDRAVGRHAHMTNAQRDEAARLENERREQRNALAMAESFKEGYQPSFTLEYPDANGRLMDQKEAFRQLSHQFHGKTPGNTKQAKYAKKLEKEKERVANQVFDIERQAKAEQHRQEKKQAGYRLG